MRSIPIMIVLMLTTACSGSGLSGVSPGGAKNKKKSGGETLGTEEAGETTKDKDRGQGGDEGGNEPAGDGELRVIPPEIVSGAYLTCVGERGDPNDQTSSLDYGCAAYDKNGARLSLAGAVQVWTLKTNEGTDVAAQDKGPQESLDQVWRLNERVPVSELHPKVVLTTGAIEPRDDVCTVATVAGGQKLETCIKLTDVCAACSKATMYITDLGGDPSSNYLVVTTEAGSAKDVCSGPPTATSTQSATRVNGRIKLVFGFTAKPALCFQLKAEVGGKIVDGGILD